MKNISKKQIIFLVIAVIVVIAGISVFFAISMTEKKDTVEISLPSAISDEKFVLAEVSKKELTDYYFSDGVESGTTPFFAFMPSDQLGFLENYVLNNKNFVEEYLTVDEDNSNEYVRWLIFENNEYYLINKTDENELNMYYLYLTDITNDNSQYIYPWPGNDLLSNNSDVTHTYDEFSNFGGCISIQSFSDLAEFYSRFTNDICQINYEEQTILVKGVNTETKEISDGFLLEITATEEGFSAKKI